MVQAYSKKKWVIDIIYASQNEIEQKLAGIFESNIEGGKKFNPTPGNLGSATKCIGLVLLTLYTRARVEQTRGMYQSLHLEYSHTIWKTLSRSHV